jgi:predicted P-loop ATPase
MSGSGRGGWTGRAKPKDASRLSLLIRELRTGAAWKDRFQFNEFTRCEEMLDQHDVMVPVGRIELITIREALQEAGYRGASKSDVADAVTRVCHDRVYHPVRDWLEGLQWDGQHRMDHWLTHQLGCDITEYVRRIGRMFLIAMVARAMRPGCQMDYMLILEGRQGAGKSRACRVLGGEWFSDSLPPLGRDPVRVSMALPGNWVIEISELAAIQGAQAEILKAFVARPVEKYTRLYGAGPSQEPRSCVLIGTTNQTHDYLTDSTGGRRFWPVAVGEVEVAGLAAIRDQLFAEAVVAWKADEPWWPDEALEVEILREQEERQEGHEWLKVIKPWLAGKGPVSALDVWTDCLHRPTEEYNQRTHGRDIGLCLHVLGRVRAKGHRTSRLWVEIPMVP